VGADVADALAALHGLPDGSGRPAGLVHQDVTPDNVLVGLDGRAVLVDLGAAVAAATPPAAFASQATPGYLAPERRTGAAPGARTDLWQLGALLAELASGRRGAAALTALGGGAAADALGAPLLVTLRALVAVDPVERPATAGELAVRLRALAGDPARMGAALAAWTRRTLGEPAA
jgi:serine/threonine-protein kinase